MTDQEKLIELVEESKKLVKIAKACDAINNALDAFADTHYTETEKENLIQTILFMAERRRNK